MTETRPQAAVDRLEQLVTAILVGAGVAAEDATVVANEVVDAEARGYESQGLMRVPSYVAAATSGATASPTRLEAIREAPSAVTWDAHDGWGHVAALRATEECARRAKETGACIGVIRNVGHIGRLGYYVEAAAELGVIGFIACSGNASSAMMAPWGGREPRLSTNPFAYGFPYPDGDNVVIDVSTTQAARGKVLVARATGSAIPDTWAFDATGSPTTDPDSALPPDGTLAPLGGHKGYALAIAVELLCGGLGGPYPPPQASGFVAAIDPEALSPGGGLATAVRIASAAMSSSAPRAGFDEVLMPGAGSARRKAKAGEEGVYVVAEVWEAVRAAADGLGLQVAV